ncbi:hypothetical protein [Nesterenkonia alkaliphila]|uniref:Uncharacterized protein n=1 Tax=Nesterenkonia alkaliphila TaxID=1463631 RepID=A0A7K1UJ19_9MICC|nr:hypothetical protein [Nesterenkonia alkaliphila]MVT26470.1 hypothetical protein [Nesterenkonia alkaliphila]GFZ81313.1 hypothetical protein GCM10011359_07250 [Nesterenkonia alkaliphila]
MTKPLRPESTEGEAAGTTPPPAPDSADAAPSADSPQVPETAAPSPASPMSPDSPTSPHSPSPISASSAGSPVPAAAAEGDAPEEEGPEENGAAEEHPEEEGPEEEGAAEEGAAAGGDAGEASAVDQQPAEPEPAVQSAEPEPAEQPSEEEPSSQETASAERPAVAVEPPARTGVAPIVNVPTGPDTGLGGFFDSLDERLKTWWATRDERKARRRAAAQQQRQQHAAAQQGPAQPAETQQEAQAPAQQPSSSAPAAAVGSPAGFSLPKPPPPEQRPSGQLFTGAIPQVGAGSTGGETPLGSAAAPAFTPKDQISEAPADADAMPEFPPRPEAGEDQTTVIPPYRGEPTALEQNPVPRVRRELDDQRQRTVIAQKAAAIEKATAQPSPRPYGGAGTIGAGYPAPAYEFADDEEDLYTYIPPYNLPSRDPDPEPTRWDLARRITVSLGAVCAVLASFWMLGWFGTSEERPAILRQNGLRETLAEGMFSGDHALLSPDHTWYWLWPLITIGLVIHALYQWRPSQHSTPRQQRSGWLVATAAVFMLVMTYALYSGAFTLALLSSLVIAGVLTEAIRQFNLYTARTNTERQLTDDIVGLFYGFALVQLMSVLSVWLTQRGWEFLGLPALLWASLGLLLAVWTASFYAMTERGRITIALGLAWGLFWLIFPRILGEVTSTGVALGAALGAFIVIICTQSRRHRINHAERRAAMGRPLEDII